MPNICKDCKSEMISVGDHPENPTFRKWKCPKCDLGKRTCIVCLKEYPVNTSRVNRKNKRGKNTICCSSKCTRTYNRIDKHIRSRLRNKKLKELKNVRKN
jgi:hypothetical protein